MNEIDAFSIFCAFDAGLWKGHSQMRLSKMTDIENPRGQLPPTDSADFFDHTSPLLDNEAGSERTRRAVDVHVGGRVRSRRVLLDMTQEDLADKLDLSFQQIQKYERGTNRISASRLFAIAEILEVPVSFFFNNMTENAKLGGAAVHPSFEGPSADDDVMQRQESLRLVQAYFRITDPAVRQTIFSLLKSLADKA